MNGDGSASSVSGGFKNKTIFIIQILTILLIILFCLINLTWKLTVANEKVWVGLLGSCIGYLLPNPRLKRLL